MRVGHLIGPELRAVLRENPEGVKDLLEELHPEDIADVVAELPEAEAAKLLSGIAAEDAATIFERLEDDTQEAIAEEMGPESVARVAAEMAVDDRVGLLSALDEEMSEAVFARLEKVDPVAAGEVAEHEKWPEHSAGRLMTTDFVSVTAGGTVQGAIDAIRRAPEAESVHYVYVLSAERRLVAVASLRDLLLAEASSAISEVSRVNVIAVAPTLDQEDVAKRLAKYDLVALPVVDEAGTVLGIITVDDVIDVLTEEQTEDVQKLGAVEPLEDTYFATTFWTFIRKRATWLLVLFLGEFFTSTAMRSYENALHAITALAFYVPLLVSAGGNSGGQSSSLIIRGMAVGEIKLRDWWRVLGRELGQGAVLGLVLALVGFVRVLIWKDGTRFAMVVALTLVGIVMMGCVVGSMLPFALKRLRLDPATSSAPFIASLVDVLGIVIYFNIARVLMAETIEAAGRHGAAH
ncbi:MAG: magnesium transporter [Polyangiaceae bacterium]|jgi:magnesium transporter|nr:magnesium transporter [Polyangiaceae bacterium]